MKYRKIEFKNFPLLNRFVSFIYEIKTLDEECTYRTIPSDKIGISIVVSGDAHILRTNGWEKIPSATIYGLTKQTQLIKLGKNFREIAIGFDPALLQMFVNDRMSEFTEGKTVDLCDLFNKTEIDELAEKINGSKPDHAILLAIESFLKNQLIPEKENPALFTAINLITRRKIFNVEEVSQGINVSATTLRYLFRDYVGVSPKNLIRTTRINEALKYKITSEENLTQLAYKIGYFDQSHFVHDFKKVLDITPKQYFKNKDLAFDFYNFGRWTSGSFDAKTDQK
jgi:AraC-like DNA-binding protein